MAKGVAFGTAATIGTTATVAADVIDQTLPLPQFVRSGVTKLGKSLNYTPTDKSFTGRFVEYAKTKI